MTGRASKGSTLQVLMLHHHSGVVSQWCDIGVFPHHCPPPTEQTQARAAGDFTPDEKHL